ncbi:hypothetical protein Tco_1220821 [Tanacetum coccineum]
MASFDYRLNPLYTIKECSSCGALYTTDYCCSKGGLVDKIIRERPPQNCETCGDPVDGLYCRPCAFVRSAPQESFVFNQDPGKNSSQSPPHIDHNCCYECGDSLDDIFCQRCIFTPVLLTEEPVDSLIIEDEHLDTIPAIESDEVIKSSVENLVPILTFKEHSEIVINFNVDSTSSDDDSPYGEDIYYVDASPLDSELVSLEVVEIVIPEVGGIDTDILLTIKDDVLCEKLLNVNLLIAKIEALKDNPTPSFDVMTKSSSTSPNFFLEETNTVDNSLPETKTFCFNLEEISSGSPISYSDLSLPDYEAFYLDDDHVEEKSSGSTTTHADFSQYDSFIFDLLINPCPPADRSDCYHEEFAGELAHIISPPEYDCFYFKNEPDQGNFMMDVVEDIFDNLTREPIVHVPNVLPTHPTLHRDLDFTLSSDSIGSDLVVSFPSGTRNKIFDPGIFIGV